MMAWCHLWHLCGMLLFAQGVQSLRNVSLLVSPPAVQRGQDASLICLYDLEGAPLYSVKWYRGNLEFYRYAPREKPPTKIFPFNGIHVDLSVSNETQVVLRRVGFNLSGNFSCEVTVDAPSFSTKTVYEQLLVVALPPGPPELYTEKERYDPGDILRANCSSPPSKPAASITFLLNNVPVGYPETKYHRAIDFLESSSQSLTMQLFPSHFDQNYLDLTCTAHIGSLYRRSVQVRLYGRTKEPIPERVSSPSASSRTIAEIFIVLITILLFCAR